MTVLSAATYNCEEHSAFVSECAAVRHGAGKTEEDHVQNESLLKRISINPNICFGKPCIRGHRIWVSLILDLLASGMSTEEVLREYPGLEEADVRACIAYGAEMSRERFVEVALES